MPKTIIAITDSPFPSLDPAKQALAQLDPEYRMFLFLRVLPAISIFEMRTLLPEAEVKE